MKTIKDIRLYKSEQRSDLCGFVTHSFASRELNAVLHRIVMKLRESGFSLGEFDHLYVNFTTCDIPQRILLSEEVDRYHPWYRYCSVAVSEEVFRALGTAASYSGIISLVEEILVICFATEAFDAQKIRSCIDQAVAQGEHMLMAFKSKSTAKRKATVYLRFLDNCQYHPLLRVYDTEDNLLLERDLPKMTMLDDLGEIQLSAKKVTIKPRRNAYTAGRKPIVIEH